MAVRAGPIAYSEHLRGSLPNLFLIALCFDIEKRYWKAAATIVALGAPFLELNVATLVPKEVDRRTLAESWGCADHPEWRS
jgi:hypothetical protein